MKKKPQADRKEAQATAKDQRFKWCVVCGRTIGWRRKWQREWKDVKYCSQKCRKAGLKPIDHALENVILQLLHNRPRSASICPSEAARLVRPPGGDESWRELVASARNAARRLAARNRIVFLQSGRQVDPSTAKGPVRLKRL